MDSLFTRTECMLGKEAVEILRKSHVLVFGLGGVGSYAAETLVRGGIENLTLVDNECYEPTNCNRQLFATEKTVGMKKTEAAKCKLLEINPRCNIRLFPVFYDEATEPEDLFEKVDYVLDAIDTLSSKMTLIRRCNELGIPVISCMGTGNKLDPTAFRITDIYKTNTCPLARTVRSACRKAGIPSLKVLYSEEEPLRTLVAQKNGRNIPGSVSFVPGVAGMILAGEVIKDLIKCLS